MFGSEHISAGSRSLPLVVLAGSQGGYGAAIEIIGALPADFPAAIVLVLHRASASGDPLPRLIEARTGFAARAVRDGDGLRAGTVHVAPRGCDLVVTVDGLLVTRARPVSSMPHSADRVLCSAAAAMGERTIAVVLSGRLDDGAEGVRALKAAGGRVLVQDPQSAEQPAMPTAALATGCVDFALAPATVAAALTSLLMVAGADALFRVRRHPGAVAIRSR